MFWLETAAKVFLLRWIWPVLSGVLAVVVFATGAPIVFGLVSLGLSSGAVVGVFLMLVLGLPIVVGLLISRHLREQERQRGEYEARLWRAAQGEREEAADRDFRDALRRWDRRTGRHHEKRQPNAAGREWNKAVRARLAVRSCAEKTPIGIYCP